MTGTRARWQASLSRALKALLLKGAPSRPGKTSGDPAKSIPPVRRRTPLTLSRKANHSFKRTRQFGGEGQIAKRAAFDLEANGDNHSTRLTHQPIERQKRPLMVSAAGKEEGGSEVIDDMRVPRRPS